MKTLKCEGHCKNMTMTCPNVKSYPNLSKRTVHSEVKCTKCGNRWLWGLSWNGSKDGEFVCPDCLYHYEKCTIEDCIKVATVEIKDLDYKGNRTWFCIEHASSFDAKEKYLETEEAAATGN